MTCNHCCGADMLFDMKSAQKEMKRYKRKGVKKVTDKLLKLLFQQNIKGSTLLDIGGGVGAIQWRFLKNGGKATIDVDASQGYLNVAKSYAKENYILDKTQFYHGDFIDVADEIDSCDFVTLDKVVCCYPDYKSLLSLALQKCDRAIALSFPFGGPISKGVALVMKLYLYIKRNPFRSFIHAPEEIEKFILSSGFEIAKKSTSFPWHVRVYKRKTD